MQFKLTDKVRVVKDNDVLKGQKGTITSIVYNRNHDNFCVSFKFNTKRTDVYYNTEDLVRL